MPAPGADGETAEETLDTLVRRYGTATVLFHHAIAERLGLGPSDHKCLDLLRERGPITGSRLAALTGLTTGGVTGIVARLERAGYVVREPDPHDRRKFLLRSAPVWASEVAALFDSMRDDAAVLVEGFDDRELAAIAEFLRRGTDFSYRQTALLRAQDLKEHQP
ncbi:MAG: MarR family transcriptional regulator [Pseudonocardia sp.]|nr:MarR family transcriptional regulator [Pseudonocardia sp.]